MTLDKDTKLKDLKDLLVPLVPVKIEVPKEQTITIQLPNISNTTKSGIKIKNYWKKRKHDQTDQKETLIQNIISECNQINTEISEKISLKEILEEY